MARENDPFARDSRALSQLAQISITSFALSGIRRTNNYEFPIDKFAAAQPRECFYQNVHALFRMHATDIEDDFCARLQRRGAPAEIVCGRGYGMAMTFCADDGVSPLMASATSLDGVCNRAAFPYRGI